ncbi:hypothetical protein [Pseudobacteroides cellulosolvens]|uniref:Uncharacterized protein n=1 Tax=Pseudobacteroides cellulosolvens ATCC 35603 = DSM 2933 TaxID=398512 RepID=A0A0L6JWJ5_9FIRM|nr:hypothetical protein [Pseudobacteroides cellulosolvens]KNY30208.1 hypothetical protein Bccel_5485 [Pseudobacteroides cellulosolvens ATCC 35603 = DSM 2933]
MKKFFIVLGTIMFGVSAFMIYLGYDKITNYTNLSSSIDSTGSISNSLRNNAYVGGDAYNYIINSNYATGFFVLAVLFVILGFGFIIIGYLQSIESLNESLKYLNKKQIDLVSNANSKVNNT